MDIAGHLTGGIAPLNIMFSVEDSVVKIVKWMWYFGDGSYSVEPNPVHTYVAPGIYTVSLTITDEYGNVYTFKKVNYIYVYTYPIGAQGLLSGHTDFCFRHAVKPTQGQGITPFGGRWLWPMIVASTAKGFNDNHENLSLVINSEDMRIYRIGVPEVWTDREGSYDEAEIPCEAMLPDIKSRYGEHENVRHVETHVSMRSWDELRYRGKSGYTSDGFRNAQELSLEAFENGEQVVPATKLREVQRGGDYAFMKEVEAKRFQIKLKYTTSAFRTTRIASHCQEIDHRTPPQINDIPEKRWQREFRTPDLWFSRNKPAVNINRADGVAWTGTGTPVTGPDQKVSGFNSTGLTGVLGYTLGEFSISAWLIGDGTIFAAQVAGGGVVSLEVVGDTLIFTDGTNTAQWPMAASATWRYLTVTRRGQNLELYEAGRLRISQPLVSSLSYGGNTQVAVGVCFDIRRISRALSSDSMYFYYESVLTGGGGFLP